MNTRFEDVREESVGIDSTPIQIFFFQIISSYYVI